jgi:hypothetical protein
MALCTGHQHPAVHCRAQARGELQQSRPTGTWARAAAYLERVNSLVDQARACSAAAADSARHAVLVDQACEALCFYYRHSLAAKEALVLSSTMYDSVFTYKPCYRKVLLTVYSTYKPCYRGFYV